MAGGWLIETWMNTHVTLIRGLPPLLTHYGKYLSFTSPFNKNNNELFLPRTQATPVAKSVARPIGMSG